MFTIYVQDGRGQIFFVGNRETKTEADQDAAIYNADPIQQGTFYVVDKTDVKKAVAAAATVMSIVDEIFPGSELKL